MGVLEGLFSCPEGSIGSMSITRQLVKKLDRFYQRNINMAKRRLLARISLVSELLRRRCITEMAKTGPMHGFLSITPDTTLYR